MSDDFYVICTNQSDFWTKISRNFKYVCSKLLNCASNVQNKKKLRWN